MELKKEEAKRIYDIQPDWMKEKLELEFGKETFKKRDFTDFKTFDDVCRELGTSEQEFEDDWEHRSLSKTLKTVAKIEMLSLVINEEWMPDTLNTKQKKWFPFFSVSSSGLDFSDSGYGYVDADAGVGFPFCFESEEKSNWAGKQFTWLWEEFFLRKTK